MPNHKKCLCNATPGCLSCCNSLNYSCFAHSSCFFSSGSVSTHTPTPQQTPHCVKMNEYLEENERPFGDLIRTRTLTHSHPLFGPRVKGCFSTSPKLLPVQLVALAQVTCVSLLDDVENATGNTLRDSVAIHPSESTKTN